MKNVLEYLEQSESKYAEKKAIALKDKSYNYAELVKLSKGVGASIKACNVIDSPIGVFAYSDILTLPMFLGTLYSANYYVPIDPNLPVEKMKSIFDDARFCVILATDADKPIIESLGFHGTILTIDDIRTDVDIEIPETKDDTPIYMVYTSGSTGKPKGVLKSHSAVIHYIETYVSTFDFDENEIIGNQTPFFFDASAKDIYLMLKLGCTLEILPSTIFSLPPELIGYLNEKKVTVASWVPTVISIVAQLNPFSMIKPTTLKKIFFVGEIMPMKHLNKWREALPDIQYVNLYGSSEMAGVCCYYEVGPGFDGDILPIGKPFGNTKIYLVSDGKVISESGKVGEIHIVSNSLALEYFHDAEKTNNCFFEIDFGNGKERCFKSGDLAKYDEDGNLVFVARIDYQIKHMGHRIELGEIEAIADRFDDIARCCCLYNKTKNKIVLFCELTDGSTLSGKEIRSALRVKLSNYMLPNKVVVMQKLPINSNGKLNRQELEKLL